MNKPITATVDKIRKMNFEGNIIPQSWYENIRTERGKVDLAGCAILADIIYWYRPSEYRDEKTGRTKYYRKFAGERLQRSYEEQGEMLGLTKDQARDAMYRLCDAGLIIITVENGVRFGNGTVGSGVVYLEPVPEAIAEITYRVEEIEGQEISRPPSGNLPRGVSKSTDPYTKTTTETTIILTKENQPKQPDPVYCQDVDWNGLKSVTADDTPPDPFNVAISKINSILPYTKVTKSQKEDVRELVDADNSLIALESAIGDVVAKQGAGNGFVNFNLVVAYWRNRLNAASIGKLNGNGSHRSSFSDLPTVDEIRARDEQQATQMAFP